MVAIKVRKLSSIFEKMTGLTDAEKVHSVYFTTRFGIHTFLMKFPIDVLILDKENIVVRLSNNLKPNRFFFWPPMYDKVVELPPGDIRRLKIKAGDKIKLEIVNRFTKAV